VEKVNLADKFRLFNEHWKPKIVGELNGQLVKLVKFKGPFVWHQHESEDELFLVVSGSMYVELREGRIKLDAGEFLIVPRGTDHRPVADEETEALIFEPASTVNTGSVRSEMTVNKLDRI